MSGYEYYQLIEFCKSNFERFSEESENLFVFPLKVALPDFLFDYNKIAFGITKEELVILEDELPLEPFSLEEYSKESLARYIEKSWAVIKNLLEERLENFAIEGKYYIQMIFYLEDKNLFSVYAVHIAEVRSLGQFI